MRLDPHKIYRECLGNLEMRSAWQNVIWEKWDEAENGGRLSEGYKRFLIACLVAAGADIDNYAGHDSDWGDKAVRT